VVGNGTVFLNDVTVKGWSSGATTPVIYNFGIASNGIIFFFFLCIFSF
jgi:hypothetical protein